MRRNRERFGGNGSGAYQGAYSTLARWVPSLPHQLQAQQRDGRRGRRLSGVALKGRYKEEQSPRPLGALVDNRALIA